MPKLKKVHLVDVGYQFDRPIEKGRIPQDPPFRF